MNKRVGVLSGGERTRLAIAKLLVSPVGVLCLDEPTNHLDIPSRDVLEDALIECAGALVLITHDRHLINSVANRIVEVVDGRIRVYDGDYDYYLFKRDSRGEPAGDHQRPSTSNVDRKSAPRADRAALKRLRESVSRIENDLEQVHAEVGRIAGRLADPAVYASGADVVALCRDYELQTKRAKELEAAWEEAAGLLEAQGVSEEA